MSAGNLLALESLSVRFPSDGGEVRVVDDVDLSLDAGTMLSLVGESGGGKTMLGLAICGLLPPDAVRTGRILWRGEALTDEGPPDDRRLGRRMAMVFQDPAASLDPVLTVGAQLVETIGHLKGFRGAEARDRAGALLKEVGIEVPALIFDRYSHQISGGQRQRVMLALAIAGDPQLLVADEPTTSLDPSLRLDILALLKDLTRSRRMATLLITHDISLAAAASDRAMVMQRGRIVDGGPTERLLSDPAAEHTRQLLAALPRNMAPSPPARSGEGGPLLRIAGVTVDYTARSGPLGMARTRVSPLRPTDLDLEAGEALALVGESGCGKTTLARAASLLIEPATGTVSLSGRALFLSSPGAERRRIQMIFQDAFASLNPRLRCGETLLEAVRVATGRDEATARERTRDLARTVDLPLRALDRFPHQLSGGQRQRVAIARALAAEPRLIIADEPTSSLDLPTQAGIMDLFTRLRTDLGVGILLITHDMELARACCNRIAVMYAGLIVEILETDGEPAHPYSRRLIEAGSRRPETHSPTGRTLRTPYRGDRKTGVIGCPYAPSCGLVEPDCRESEPPLLPIAKNHLLRCPKAPRIGGRH